MLWFFFLRWEDKKQEEISEIVDGTFGIHADSFELSSWQVTPHDFIKSYLYHIPEEVPPLHCQNQAKLSSTSNSRTFPPFFRAGEGSVNFLHQLLKDPPPLYTKKKVTARRKDYQYFLMHY